MEFFKRIFHRKREQKPRPLRIDGVKTTLTPVPDDAELAAQALLESRIYGDKSQRNAAKRRQPSEVHDAEHYRELGEKIRAAHEQDRRMAMRFVAYVEQELTSAVSRQPSDFASLEHQLFKHQNTVEHEGGELLKRWQHCLAECIMRQITTTEANGEYQSSTGTTDKKE